MSDPLSTTFAADHYAAVSPDDLPPLHDLSDDDGDDMEAEFLAEMDRLERQSIDDQSDDAEALASAGMGTDEDYGGDGTRWDDAEYEAERDFFESDF
jgi:hypothetical protein